MLSKDKIEELQALAVRGCPDVLKYYDEDDFKTMLAGILLDAHNNVVKYGGEIDGDFEKSIRLALWNRCSNSMDCIYIIRVLYKYVGETLHNNSGCINMDDRHNQSVSKMAHFILRQVILELFKVKC